MDVAPDLKLGNLKDHRCIKDIQICFERPNKSIALDRTYQKLAALMVEWVAAEKQNIVKKVFLTVGDNIDIDDNVTGGSQKNVELTSFT